MRIKANDSAHSLEFWWDAQGEWAEPPNYRRGGVSGVQRVTLPDQQTYYVKRQSNFIFRSLRHPCGAPTLLREWRNMQVCARLGVPTAQAVVFQTRRVARQWHAMLVTHALTGYISLDEGLRQQRWDEHARAAICRAVLDAIAPLHRARRKHGHLYGKEVFVRAEGGSVQVAFLDLELCRLHVSRRKAAESDLRRLIRSLYVAGLPAQEVKDMLAYQAILGLPMSKKVAAYCLGE